MKKLARNTLALGTATLIVTAGLSFSANGADATKSYATGRFLSGSIGGTNLDALAQLKGVTAANPGNAGPNTNPLSLTLLSAIPITLPGGLNLNLADFLSPGNGSAGVANQYAAASTTSKAAGASGAVNNTGAILAPGNGQFPADAKISLSGGLLSGINNKLASVDLTLGALSSSTIVNGGTPTRDYQIAGLKLDVTVPLLAGLIGDLTTAIAPVTAANSISLSASQLCSITGTTANVLTTTLIAQLNSLAAGTGDAVGSLLSGLGLTNVNLCDRSNLLLGPVFALLDAGGLIDQLIKVDITGLNDLTTGLTNFSSGGVAVDLNTGKITLDLEAILTAAGVNLDNLPPNTNLLDYLTSNLISQKITNVLDKAVSDLVANLGKVNIAVTVAGTSVPVDLQDLTGALLPPLVGLLNTATGAVAQIGQPIDQLLGQLVPNLKQIVALTANNQSTSKTPTLGTGTVNAGSVKAAAVGDYYRTSALKVDLLTNLANIDLAASEAAVLAAPAVDDGTPPPPADDRDGPTDGPNLDGQSDTQSDTQADANADANADTVADADAQADADVTTTLPSTGAPNLLPFWLLGIALLMFGGAVLVNEKRRLNQG